MIKAITFDLDGVYFPNGKTNFIKNIVSLGVSEDEARRVFLRSDEMNKLYKTGKMTDEEFWAWTDKEWQTNKNWSELVDLLISGYDVDEKVVEVVRKIRANGYKTLICSNNFKARIEGLDKKFGFLKDFDAIVCSYEVGAVKPSETIFQELINRSGVAAGEIVFADDNQDNLTGAQKLGITTFLYEDFDKFLEQLRTLGVKI